MSCWKVSYDEQTYKQPAQSTTKKHNYVLAYADDIDIVGRSQSAVRDTYLALKREAAKVEWKITEQKTKYKLAARNDTSIRNVGQSVVKEFVYVRSLMTPTNDVSLEIQRRIQTANKCFFGLRKHMQSSHLSRQTKFTIHKILIRPVLLYGSETYVLTKREENQLLVIERKVLRTICGLKIENGVCRRRYNHELDKKFNSPNALKVTKTSRLRYAGHMIRRPEDLPQRSKPNRRRNQERPISTWADEVKKDSLARGVINWTHCAQDRQTWRYIVQKALVRFWL
jgi:hypothetical protein